MFNAIYNNADKNDFYETIMTVINFTTKFNFPFQKISAKIVCFCVVLKLTRIKIATFVFTV